MRTQTIEEAGVSAALNIYEFGSGLPRLTFTAGIHGNEVSGIYVAEQLIAYLTENPPEKGTVRVLPRCNPTATRCKQRRSPIDGEDMNRIFPGSPTGSFSHRQANAIWQETADAELIVDLHCCGQHGLLYLLATYEEHPALLGLLRSIPLPRVIRSEGTPGQLFTNACRERGQRAVIIEIPSGPSDGALNLPDAEAVFTALLNLLRAEGILPGVSEQKAPLLLNGLLDLNAPGSGLWCPLVEKGEWMRAGQTVGSLDGTPVLANGDGFIMAVRPAGYLFDDDPWAIVYAEKNAQAL